MSVHVAFSNEYGPVPSKKIVNFCGTTVINAFMAKPFVYHKRACRQGRENFVKNGVDYHVLKAKTAQANVYMFHVYKYC